MINVVYYEHGRDKRKDFMCIEESLKWLKSLIRNLAQMLFIAYKANTYRIYKHDILWEGFDWKAKLYYCNLNTVVII